MALKLWITRFVNIGFRETPFFNRYVASLGASETLGQSMPAPFPILTEQLIGHILVNLGLTHSGLDLYLKDDAVSDFSRKAQLCVLQFMGADNMSNPYYTVQLRRNNRFTRVLVVMVELLPELDFTRLHFNKDLVHQLNLM